MSKPALKALMVVMFMTFPASAVETAEECRRLGTAFSTLDEQTCFNGMALKDGWRSCLGAPDVLQCVSSVAIDNVDPTPILELTAPAGSPDVVTIYGPEVRDTLLTLYVKMTLDMPSLDLIKSSRMRDGALIMTLGTAYGRTGLAPRSDYCKKLKGDYEYDPFYNYDEPLESEFISQQNLCEQMVAAVRQLKYDNDECEKVLPGRLQDPHGWGIEDDVKECKSFVMKMKRNIKLIMSDGIEDSTMRWVLTDTQVNPYNKSLTSKVSGAGVVDTTYSVSEGRFSSYTHETYHGDVLGIIDWEVLFDSPPKILTPGHTITLTADGKATGDPWGGIGKHGGGITYMYRMMGGSSSNYTYMYVNEENP
ncbi:hypothetical protein ACFLRF_01310 [Candidatus Altiarchaeota archaeon]